MPPTRALGIVVAAIALAQAAHGQETNAANGLFLVAKPGMVDPNFSQTVVLVTQAPDYSTVGVILNRPTSLTLSRFYAPDVPTQNYRQPVYFGGPVMQQAVVAVFRSEEPPPATAFHVLKNLYLAMHAQIVTSLLSNPEAKYRLYAGFSGWAPRQLESEMRRDGWYVLPADEASVFREDMNGLWDEMVARATGPRARLSSGLHAPDPPGRK